MKEKSKEIKNSPKDSTKKRSAEDAFRLISEDSPHWRMEYPRFEGDENQKKREYFEKLTAEVKKFCKSEFFPKSSKYYVQCVVTTHGSNLEIKTKLSIRKRGHFICQKIILTRWNTDSITEQKVTVL